MVYIYFRDALLLFVYFRHNYFLFSINTKMKFTSCLMIIALIIFQLSVVVYSLQNFQSSFIYKKTSQILPPLHDSALTPILAGIIFKLFYYLYHFNH